MSPVALQIGLSFTEGLALAFSPCILPVLPLILAGGATGSKDKPLGIIVGFVIFFTLFALLSRKIFSLFGIPQDSLQTVSFGLLMLFGLVMVVPALERRFSHITQGLANRAQNLGNTGAAGRNDFRGGVVFGGLIGLVWTPCAGPVMAAALLQVIQSSTSFDAIAVIAAFSLGAGLPMLAIALSGQAILKRIRGLNRHTAAVKRVMGALLIVFAGLGFFGVNLGIAAVDQSAPRSRLALADDGILKNALPALRPAPAFTGIAQWMNSPPLTLADLKGKVVLVDFWTYSCINCIRTLPYIKDWYAKYKDKGFVVIGVHTPEFEFEGQPENVAAALKKFGIAYPVAMDNHFGTWNAFQNKYWPAHYLIDQNGQIVYTHFGEGHYDVTEHNIRTLLGVTGTVTAPVANAIATVDQTPETYLGTARAAHEWTGKPDALPLHNWQLSGRWSRQAQFIQSGVAGDTLTLHFKARKVFLVLAAQSGQNVAHISLPGQTGGLGADIKNGDVTVAAARLYELINLPQNGEGIVRIEAAGPGLQVYAFTFESHQ